MDMKTGAGSDATLATQVYHRLRNDLLDGRLSPGSKLKVQSIAAEYGAGASPVREALSSLAAEGLVQRVDQRGFRAAPVSAAEFEELVHARCLIESVVLKESIANGGPDWEEALLVANYRLTRLERGGVRHDDKVWESAHMAYHDALLGACPSPTLLAFCASLRERADRYRSIANTAKTYQSRDVVAEHEAMTAAALARNGEEAARLLVDHYSTTAKFLRLALQH